MAQVSVAKNTLKGGAFSDLVQEHEMVFDHRPTMKEIQQFVKARYALWDEELPYGSANLPYIDGIRMERAGGRYHVRVRVTTPFND